MSSEEKNHVGLGLGWASHSAESPSQTASAIEGSNIGFQLLKKCGWKEGTGLGVAEQGRLDPIETHVKHDKRGIGAENKPKKTVNCTPKENSQLQPKRSSKKVKALSKRLRKLEAEEKRRQEQALEVAFFREFWPDNV
ncbi:uncharacterized protein LOC131036015 isoform X2 [Cryptomeria japonica]|uniref:uncharacterized protein LOC131036015 isoform X2 n=1 Tax=Cryptomeria japonica TaxID=3369 RepID=UPI0025ACE046|nr:uncharacterized protein LOC131036015 isoform X2 [Cryptomeria japonica]